MNCQVHSVHKLKLSFAALALAMLPYPAPLQAQDAAWVSGVDLSHHNDVDDWSEVTRAGLGFLILKATDGMDYLDPKFVERFAQAERLGIARGAYHFYETNDDPLIQANWFIKNVTLGPGDLPPIVDIEHIKAPVFDDLHADFAKFLGHLQAHYDAAPIIYTGPNFWDHAMKDNLPGYPLWVAQYGVETPTIPEGWAGWTLWQHTDGLTVPGLDGVVDGSYFNGDAAALGAFVLPAR